MRVYIAGPISRGDLAHNLNQATAAFVALAKAGLSPFCPHWSAYSGGAMVLPSGSVYALATAHGCGLSHEEWMRADLPWVAVADAVLRLPGESAGADREVLHANALGIPVFCELSDVIAYRDRAEGREVSF